MTVRIRSITHYCSKLLGLEGTAGTIEKKWEEGFNFDQRKEVGTLKLNLSVPATAVLP